METKCGIEFEEKKKKKEVIATICIYHPCIIRKAIEMLGILLSSKTKMYTN